MKIAQNRSSYFYRLPWLGKFRLVPLSCGGPGSLNLNRVCATLQTQGATHVNNLHDNYYNLCLSEGQRKQSSIGWAKRGAGGIK